MKNEIPCHRIFCEPLLSLCVEPRSDDPSAGSVRRASGIEPSRPVIVIGHTDGAGFIQPFHPFHQSCVSRCAVHNPPAQMTFVIDTAAAAVRRDLPVVRPLDFIEVAGARCPSVARSFLPAAPSGHGHHILRQKALIPDHHHRPAEARCPEGMPELYGRLVPLIEEDDALSGLITCLHLCSISSLQYAAAIS